MDIFTCMTDSICYTPETNTTLKVNYTPIKFKKKRERRERDSEPRASTLQLDPRGQLGSRSFCRTRDKNSIRS